MTNYGMSWEAVCDSGQEQGLWSQLAWFQSLALHVLIQTNNVSVPIFVIYETEIRTTAASQAVLIT